MPDLAPTIDAQISKDNQSSWANARDATSGTASTSGTRSTQAIYAKHGAARGGGSVYSVHRAFFEFDTSGISATPSDSTLKIRGFIATSADFFVVKANFSDGALAAADFDAIVGWSAGSDNDGNVTKYSSEITTWDRNGYNDITLNAAALTSMRDDDLVKFCLIESTLDLPNNTPSSVTKATGMYFQDYTGTSLDPILNYTAGAAGYGNAVIGVAAANIGSINGVATANIEKVIGV
tara:strand:+ start:239 stop:946 length:708 start_codon:yes stop_codon:yes gene_type:complete